MTKAGKAKHRKTRRRKVEEAPPAAGEALDDAELERKYIIDRFYGCASNIFANLGLALMGIELCLIFVVPGARFTGCVGFAFWFIFSAVTKNIVRYKGTKHEMYWMKLAITIIEVAASIKETLQASNNSLTSEESRNAHAAMMILVLYFMGPFVLRLATPRYKKSPVWLLFVPLLALKYPRFGIFAPRYEALALFVAMSLGFLIGSIIDEMRWRHFLLLHEKEMEMEKTSKELSKESRKRAMAMEVLSSYQDKNSFFEIR